MIRLGREFAEALEALAEQRGLDIDAVISVMESALQSAYNKFKPSEKEMEVKINQQTGDITINEIREVV